MKKVFMLALTAAFSLVSYQVFASEEGEAKDPTAQVEVEKADTSLSFNGFKVLFNEGEEEEATPLVLKEDHEEEATLA